MAKSGMLCLALVLCAVLATSEALKCFHCNNCGDDAGTPYDCSDNNDVCLKITLAGRVQKSCAQKAACGLGAVERGVVNAWNNLKNLLSDVDQDVVDIPDDAQAKIVACCESDLCNAAPGKMANPVILILLPLLACIFRQ
ncbi:CD59 glycoprotein-like isoform X1 [Macrobrachium nipponense]|uniref:CD59 glycoprotein-like isoform X1 n=1 Tax=Macrobrachium nipponense TaxID=159736 RepID=UPI0030C7D6D9